MNKIPSTHLALFLAGVASSMKCSTSEADAQWAGFSRQLSDLERERIEAKGYEEGVIVGRQINAIV